MSIRPSLAEITARLTTVVIPLVAGVKIATLFDADYAATYGKVWPAIWLGGLRILPRDSADGLTEIARQNRNVEVSLRLMLQRNPAGSVNDLEARVIALCDAVDAALFGWRPTWARNPLAMNRSVDGPASEPSCTIDMYYAAQSARTFP